MLCEISLREREKSYDFTHMRTWRDKTDEHKEREIKIIWKRRGTKHKRLINMENKLRVARGVVGGGWAKWVRDIKESTEIIVSLYVN